MSRKEFTHEELLIDRLDDIDRAIGRVAEALERIADLLTPVEEDTSRLAALERIAAAAIRRREVSEDATNALPKLRDGLIDTETFNAAMTTMTEADFALHDALDALGSEPR